MIPLGRRRRTFSRTSEPSAQLNIDRDRIVLRGMSMGGIGTWNLG
jgi:predicted peptidase